MERGPFVIRIFFFSDGWWKALGTRRRSVSHASLPSHWAADGRHESQRIREMEVLRARAKCFLFFWRVDVCIIYD